MIIRRKKTKPNQFDLVVIQGFAPRVGQTICLGVHPVPAQKFAAARAAGIWKILETGYLLTSLDPGPQHQRLFKGLCISRLQPNPWHIVGPQ